MQHVCLSVCDAVCTVHVWHIIRIAGKFGGLAVCVKSAKFFLRVHVGMAIPYHTTKFKSTNGVKKCHFGPNRQI